MRIEPAVLRRGAIVAGLLVAEWVVLGLLLPAEGSPRRGAPLPIIFQGVVAGLGQSLTAAGIVLIHRSARVVNFAQAAMGLAGAALTFDFLQLTAVPFPIAFALGIVAAAAAGTVFDLLFVRRFFNAPRLVLTVLTVAAAGFLGGVGKSAVDALPFFPPIGDRTLAQLQGNLSLRPVLPFPKFQFTLPGLAVQFGFAELFALGTSVAALVALGLFLHRTRLGVAIRALAENSERASLLGISVGLMSTIVWSLAAALSGINATLTGLQSTPQSAGGAGPSLLLTALAAAVLARMRSLPIATAAAVGLTVLQLTLQFMQPHLASLDSAFLLLIVAGGLLLQRPEHARSERGGSSWAGTEEIRPVPAELASLPALRLLRWAAVAIVLAVAILLPFVTQTGQLYAFQFVALQGVIGISLVVLTGWAGQVSLGQYGLAAVGTVMTGLLATRLGLPFWLVLPLATATAALAAALIGVPALRLPGLFLAVATFAFGIAVHDVLFNPAINAALLPDNSVVRPALPFLSFDDERGMYYLCFGALALAIVLVLNLRRSRFGRLLIGLRENEANVQSAGISALWMKLTGFAISGGIAGFGGALLAYQQRTVTGDGFTAQANLDAFLQAVIGGVSSVFGPLIGAGVLQGSTAALASVPEVAAGVVPGLALILLYLAPAGLLSVAARLRDAALRIIAQRNQIVVPSLFADMDPEALHLRLVPLAAPVEGMGLSRIRRHYEVAASMHRDERDRAETPEAMRLTAAARTAGEPAEGPA